MARRGIARRSAAALIGSLAAAVLLGSCSSTASTGAVTVGPGAPAVPLQVGGPPPPDQVPAIAGGTPCTRPTTGWVAAENARPGTRLLLPSGRSTAGRDPARVLGYPDRWSARCGELVTVQLSGPGGSVRLVAHRIGWYHGAGARRIWTSPAVRVAPQPVPPGAAAPHLVQPRWSMSVSIPIDGSWLPGFYLLVPTGPAGAAGPVIPLTVRDDDGSEPILFKASTLTWNAYGDWGGWSLYHGPAGSAASAAADKARVVALHRPLLDAGYDQMRYMDLPVVRQLEQTGLDVAYTTDEAVDEQPGQLLRHAELVSGGHSEYWTRRMYDGMLSATTAGVNLVFLGANSLWWRARLETSPTAVSPDRLAVHRSVADDPKAAHDPLAATTLWGPAPLNRDPASILGESHAAIEVHGGLQLIAPPPWFTDGTGLSAGGVLPEAVGNEADGYNPRGRNPVGTQVLAAGVLNGRQGPTVVSTEYVTLPSGAAVFAAGTTWWACVPAGECFDEVTPAPTATAIGRLTRNVLTTFSQLRAGRRHPAVPLVPFTAAELLPQLAAGAVGSYGGDAAELDAAAADAAGVDAG